MVGISTISRIKNSDAHIDDMPVPINTAPRVLSKAGNLITNPPRDGGPELADMSVIRVWLARQRSAPECSLCQPYDIALYENAADIDTATVR